MKPHLFSPRTLSVVFAAASLPCMAQHPSWSLQEQHEQSMFFREIQRQRVAVASKYSGDTLEERIEFDTAGRIVRRQRGSSVSISQYDQLGRVVRHYYFYSGLGWLDYDKRTVYDATGRKSEQRTLQHIRGKIEERLERFQHETDRTGFHRTTISRSDDACDRFGLEAMVQIDDSSVRRREMRSVNFAPHRSFDSDSVITITRYDDQGRKTYYELEGVAGNNRTTLRRVMTTYGDGVFMQCDTSRQDLSETEMMHTIDSNARVCRWHATYTDHVDDMPVDFVRSFSGWAELDEQMRPVFWRHFLDERLMGEQRYTFRDDGLLATARMEYFPSPREEEYDGETVTEARWEYEFHPPASPKKGNIR